MARAARLKRTFRPIRPLLLPVWRRVGPIVELGPRNAWRAWRQERQRARFLDPRRRIRPVTTAELADIRRRFRYYQGRTGYMTMAGDLAGDLIVRRELDRALELGPHILPLIVGADVMDIKENPDLEGEHRVIIHDARRAPWPIDDRRYDLFVGLQVFEHLVGSQADAFLEVRRVARHAVISLPIDWVMKDPKNCHHMISHERALSWFAPVVPTRVVEGNPAPGRRMIYVFEDLPLPSAAAATSGRPLVAGG
jgi:hypothetical protein